MVLRCIETRSSLDRILGMECYLTSRGPARPLRVLDHSNFYVYEYIEDLGSLEPPITFLGDRGELYVYLLIKRGIDTYNALNKIERVLRPKRITYHGLKDSRATSYQLIVVEKPRNPVTYICAKNLEAVMLGTSSRHVKRGGNVGNCFKIAIGSLIDKGEMGEVLLILDEVERYGLIPNYYSYQRFGVKRPITHAVGMGIACGHYDYALRAIVTGDPHADPSVDLVERCGEILLKGPGWMNLERLVCRRYMETRDPEKAVKSLAKNYLDLYLSALLSYIFNLYLSLRWREHGLGLEPVRGEDLLRSRLHGVKIPGITVSMKGDGEPGYAVVEALDRYGFETCRPRISRSVVRPLVLPTGFEKRGEALEFCLDSGGYATNLLREVFKEHTPKLLSPDLDLGSSYH